MGASYTVVASWPALTAMKQILIRNSYIPSEKHTELSSLHPQFKPILVSLAFCVMYLAGNLGGVLVCRSDCCCRLYHFRSCNRRFQLRPPRLIILCTFFFVNLDDNL